MARLVDRVRQKIFDSDDRLGQFVLLYASGNRADALEVGNIVDQLGTFTVDGKDFHSTASCYILKNAYAIVMKEGPLWAWPCRLWHAWSSDQPWFAVHRVTRTRWNIALLPDVHAFHLFVDEIVVPQVGTKSGTDPITENRKRRRP